MQELSINELRQRWTKAWEMDAHVRIGRVMLEKSLEHKIREQEVRCFMPEQQARLDQLIKEYKRNPACFDVRSGALKPGTRLVRIYNGKKHSVLVKSDGFEYREQTYSSLSKIANDITGSRWNGWLFFGLKKAGTS